MNEHSLTSSYLRKGLTEVVDNEVLSNRLALKYLMKVIPETERTWWRLFQKRVMRTKCDIYVFIRLYLSVLTKNEAHVRVIVDKKKKNIHTISVYF